MPMTAKELSKQFDKGNSKESKLQVPRYSL